VFEACLVLLRYKQRERWEVDDIVRATLTVLMNTSSLKI
jgi:hypothetical protein